MDAHYRTHSCDYARSLRSRMDELRHDAITVTTWMDESRLIEHIEEDLDWIRGMVKSSHQRVQAYKRKISRREYKWQLKGWGEYDVDGFWAGMLQRRIDTLRISQSYRDELREALVYIKRCRREEAREMERWSQHA